MNATLKNAIHRHQSNTLVGQFCALISLAMPCLLTCGCIDNSEPVATVKVWAQRGLGDGRFHKPRAIAVDSKDNLFVIDMTGRIQVFDSNQKFVRSWRTPAVKTGKPCGLTVSNDDFLMVADTHYHQVLFYDIDGNILEDRTLGGKQGLGPGEFGFVTDVVQDSKGNYYVSEYGDFDRIQKFSPEGKFILQWGGRGEEPGQFLRPQGLAVDEQDRIWVADASNHRIQVFDANVEMDEAAKLLFTWGTHGRGAGEIRFPYDIVLEGDEVFVCEFGNHRIQRFTRDGKSLGMWGMPGRQPGQMHQPWAMTIDSKQQMHVLDSYNHRIQTLKYDGWQWPRHTEIPTDPNSE